jgi:hypothetical protein
VFRICISTLFCAQDFLANGQAGKPFRCLLRTSK